MKLVLFNLREDEKSALNNWIAAHPEVEVDVHSEELTASNKLLFRKVYFGQELHHLYLLINVYY